jgi:hypothetical protein
MNEMKSKAIEKLMMVLDEVLGGDVASRLKEKMHESTESEDEGEEEGEEGKKTASGGASIMALPEAESEDMPSEEKDKMKGIGIEMQDVKVAAMPRSGLMKRMHGGKKPA